MSQPPYFRFLKRRHFLAAPAVACLAGGSLSAAAADSRVYAFGDGIPLSPAEYAGLLKTIADKEKLSLVVEKGDNGAGALVVYSHPSLDITDRVIKELDKGTK